MSFGNGSAGANHTTNEAPFVVCGDKYIGAKFFDGGALCDVAPTPLLKLWTRLSPRKRPEKPDNKIIYKGF